MIDARTGKCLTAACQDAAQRYQLAVDCILGSESGATETLDQALALDGEFAVALAARYMLSKDSRSTGAELFKERALQAAEKASSWERAHIFALFGLLEDPYGN